MFSNMIGGPSLTRRFSWVFGNHDDQNRFNGFRHTAETVETVRAFTRSPVTQLKQGVNETASQGVSNVVKFIFHGVKSSEPPNGRWKEVGKNLPATTLLAEQQPESDEAANCDATLPSFIDILAHEPRADFSRTRPTD